MRAMGKDTPRFALFAQQAAEAKQKQAEAASMTQTKYPVVDPDPSIGRFVRNFNVSDYSTVAGFTAIGWTVGFFGAQRKLRGSHAKFCAAIGLLGGLLVASQSSYLRLMGHRENSSEVRRYGEFKPEQKTA